jgi:ribosome-binding factor A
MGKKYQRRVAELIRVHLADLLGRKANDPRLHTVNITEVAVTPDTARAHVYYVVQGDEEERQVVADGLASAASWLRRELGGRVRLRNTPELVFHYDPSLDRGEHIAGILEGLGLGDDTSVEPDTEQG